MVQISSVDGKGRFKGTSNLFIFPGKIGFNRK